MEKIFEINQMTGSVTVYTTHLFIDLKGGFVPTPVLPRTISIPINAIQDVQTASFYGRITIFTTDGRKFTFLGGGSASEAKKLREVILNTRDEYTSEAIETGIVVEYQIKDSPEERKTKRLIATLVEVFGGLLGFLGAGNILVSILEKAWGFAVVGATLILIWWSFIFSSITSIIGSFGIGLICLPCILPMWLILPILSGLLLYSRYSKE